MEYPHCAICLKTIESDGIVLASKGIDGVNRASKARGDTFSVVQGDSVHKECRQTIPAQITLTNMYVRVKRQNTPEEIFVRAENCRLTLKKTAYFVERRLTKNKNEKGQGLCVDECGPEGTSVLRRCARGFKASMTSLLLFLTIHVAQVFVAQNCKTNMNIPHSFISDQPEKKMKTGRPVDQNLNQAFLKLVQYVEENDDKQVTVSDLTEKKNARVFGRVGCRNGIQHPSYERMINGAFWREHNNYKQT